jgi:hypothetical protein
MTKLNILLTCLMVLWIGQAHAHHSFSIYDVDNKIALTGVITVFTFTNPHIKLTVEVAGENGSMEIWEIESLNVGRWDRAGHPRDIASVGENVTILGWPARNGTNELLLSTIITDRSKTVLIKEVRQRKARENLPEVTIKR